MCTIISLWFLGKEVLRVTINYEEFISVSNYNMLREAVGWGRLWDEQAQQGLDNSAYVVSCYDDNVAVGSARIIWDKGYISYLADIMVKPEYQGYGIGKHLVEMAIAFMKTQIKEGWKIKIVLVSAKGKEDFYKKFGSAKDQMKMQV